MMRFRLLALFILFAMVACAQTVRWEHPSASHERMVRDKAACKRLAAKEAEREYQKQRVLGGDEFGRDESKYDASMAIFEIRKFETRVFENCMAEKGYTKAKGSE
jgi:hypothetical protein